MSDELDRFDYIGGFDGHLCLAIAETHYDNICEHAFMENALYTPDGIYFHPHGVYTFVWDEPYLVSKDDCVPQAEWFPRIIDYLREIPEDEYYIEGYITNGDHDKVFYAAGTLYGYFTSTIAFDIKGIPQPLPSPNVRMRARLTSTFWVDPGIETQDGFLDLWRNRDVPVHEGPREGTIVLTQFGPGNPYADAAGGETYLALYLETLVSFTDLDEFDQLADAFFRDTELLVEAVCGGYEEWTQSSEGA